MRMTGAILGLVKSQKGNIISFVGSIIISLTLSPFRGSPNSVWKDFRIQNGFQNEGKMEPKLIAQ